MAPDRNEQLPANCGLPPMPASACRDRSGVALAQFLQRGGQLAVGLDMIRPW